MNEAETRAEHIDPALKAAGWGVVEGSRIRREVSIIPGRIEALSPEAVADSIAAGNMEAVPAAAAPGEVEYLFERLLAKNPALLGGRVPPDAFYGGKAAPRWTCSATCGAPSIAGCASTPRWAAGRQRTDGQHEQ